MLMRIVYWMTRKNQARNRIEEVRIEKWANLIKSGNILNSCNINDFDGYICSKFALIHTVRNQSIVLGS